MKISVFDFFIKFNYFNKIKNFPLLIFIQVASLGSRDDYLTSMNREIGWIADASRRMENESLLPSSSRSKINWRKAPSSLNE